MDQKLPCILVLVGFSPWGCWVVRGCVPVTGALARLGGQVLLLPLLVLKGSNVLILTLLALL